MTKEQEDAYQLGEAHYERGLADVPPHDMPAELHAAFADGYRDARIHAFWSQRSA